MRIITVIFLLAVLRPAVAQEFIGLTEKNIREIMSAGRPEMTLDNQVRNDTYRYLKYRSKDDSETWVIFIDDRGRCEGVRVTCDNSCYESMVKELNETYVPGLENRWTSRAGGNEVTVVLNKGSWFFTVTYERKKQKE